MRWPESSAVVNPKIVQPFFALLLFGILSSHGWIIVLGGSGGSQSNSAALAALPGLTGGTPAHAGTAAKRGLALGAAVQPGALAGPRPMPPSVAGTTTTGQSQGPNSAAPNPATTAPYSVDNVVVQGSPDGTESFGDGGGSVGDPSPPFIGADPPPGSGSGSGFPPASGPGGPPQPHITELPEPGALALLAAGLIGLALAGRRRTVNSDG